MAGGVGHVAADYWTQFGAKVGRKHDPVRVCSVCARCRCELPRVAQGASGGVSTQEDSQQKTIAETGGKAPWSTGDDLPVLMRQVNTTDLGR